MTECPIYYILYLWHLENTIEFENCVLSQDEDAREAITKNLIVLSEFGPNLGRPYVDTIE